MKASNLSREAHRDGLLLSENYFPSVPVSARSGGRVERLTNTREFLFGGAMEKPKSGRIIDRGYVMVLLHDHPRSSSKNYVPEHVLILEKVLGKPLPPGVVAHHVDGDPTNNKNSNLVACQDTPYHNLLHRRERALKACGHASWRKCCYCKKYDDPLTMRGRANGASYHHRDCINAYERQNRKNKSRKRLGG